MSIPRVYTHPILVKKKDLDELNHVNNVVYLSYLQESAIAHWYSTAPKKIAEAIRWVVRKHEIEYFKPAHLSEKLTVTTWVSNFTQISSERHYEIRRGDDLLVKASTLWIALDSKKMKPTRIPISEIESFFES